MTNYQKWFLILALWVLLLFGAFIFYWFNVRPVNIRRMCSERAKACSEEVKSSVKNMLETHQAVYYDCLKQHGVEK